MENLSLAAMDMTILRTSDLLLQSIASNPSSRRQTRDLLNILLEALPITCPDCIRVNRMWLRRLHEIEMSMSHNTDDILALLVILQT